MRLSTDLFCLYAILVVDVITQCYTNEIYTKFNVTENGATNVTPGLRMITECETPNGNPGYCMNLKLCKILLNQINNRRAWDFLRASKCEGTSGGSPSVCCGKEDNFRNVSGNTGNSLPTSCGYQKPLPEGNRIFGGTPAFLGEYPWMALVLHRSRYGQTVLGCGGFLIHAKYVLTAAHCTHQTALDQRGPIISVLLGEHNVATSTDCSKDVCVRNTQSLKIEKVITHPNYDPASRSQHNDIAVIILKADARFTDFVQPICLVEDDSHTPNEFYLSGWGRTENKSYSKVKMSVKIPSYDKEDCVEKFSSSGIDLDDTQMCAGGEATVDSCTGDSGGPLMSKSNGRWYAWGIVSFGMGCGLQDWPGVYTNVTKLLPWIKEQMR